MVEINFLAESDRADWEVLARGKDAYFNTVRTDDDYEQTWQRLLKGGETRGVAAWLDGKMVAIAHYVFHASIWGAGRSYLADLYVDADVRRQGVATQVINWVAKDGEDHGFPRLYWNTLHDAEARALYDKLGKFHDGFIFYSYRR